MFRATVISGTKVYRVATTAVDIDSALADVRAQLAVGGVSLSDAHTLKLVERPAKNAVRVSDYVARARKPKTPAPASTPAKPQANIGPKR